MIISITYRNVANGETYRLALELREHENELDAAWSRGLRTCCHRTGWDQHDITLAINE